MWYTIELGENLRAWEDRGEKTGNLEGSTTMGDMIVFHFLYIKLEIEKIFSQIN